MVVMHGYGTMWPMSAMMVGWLALTALVVALVVWAVVRGARPTDNRDVNEAPRRILAERYARGELDTEEYTKRLATLS
jgi:putative membrane protein